MAFTLTFFAHSMYRSVLGSIGPRLQVKGLAAGSRAQKPKTLQLLGSMRLKPMGVSQTWEVHDLLGV